MDHAGVLKLLNETANKYGKAKPIFLENSVPAVQIRFFRNTGQMPTHAGQHWKTHLLGFKHYKSLLEEWFLRTTNMTDAILIILSK